MFTHFFIDRPILSSVISILIVLAGAVSMVASPIEQYPDMAPPQVTITAIYPGATAEVIANNVAAPIETQLNGIDNLLYFYSTSSSSGNAADRGGVQAGLEPGHQPGQRAEQAVRRPRRRSRRWCAAGPGGRQEVAEHHDGGVHLFARRALRRAAYIGNYANLYVLDELKRIPGANRSSTFGLARHRDARLAAPRPHGAARHHGAGGAAPRSRARTRPSASARSARRPRGRASSSSSWSPRRACSPSRRSSRTSSCAPRKRRRRDRAHPATSAASSLNKRDYSMVSRMNGKTATTIGVYQQPGANAVRPSRAGEEAHGGAEGQVPHRPRLQDRARHQPSSHSSRSTRRSTLSSKR